MSSLTNSTKAQCYAGLDLVCDRKCSSKEECSQTGHIAAQDELAIAIEEWVSDVELAVNNVDDEILGMMREPERKFILDTRKFIKEYREATANAHAD